MPSFGNLPSGLPVPTDDGAADHLLGASVASVLLPTTDGRHIDLSQHESTWLVIYVYPMTGRPDQSLPEGWDMIPGARGCTPQSCSFRDRSAALADLGAEVVGMSVQDREYQEEMVNRLQLPYTVVSDVGRAFGDAMKLPVLEVTMPSGHPVELYKRLTLIARLGTIEHVMYPVFPPDQNAAEVEAWIRHA
jgi:peroxiredoxin